ncbi:hypothetical protein PHYPSEUDO_015578 [Phytophthora pseudosyringae]|uniref:RNase H type-1 domain-containing protein n=1 Tax=Phytophthora pseudosyringae TaxID=221518 RepID=A0A8T1W1Q4_9STRA|nr:hypothetical protein PHYPSEUDO_015578 [Phytophthora pseudosyringae]
MFFDGGCRGNRPGGAGAAVVRIAGDAGPYQVVWAGSMSYAAGTTTNNIAENLGLLTGLTACGKLGNSPVHVVGGSEMIIRQHRSRHPPKAAHLKPIYWTRRRLIAKVQVASWHHHLREFNKMADWLANQAMDSKRSSQVCLKQESSTAGLWRHLKELAGGDVGHWILEYGIANPAGEANVGL